MRVLAILLAASVATSAQAGNPIAPVHPGASATKARDIQGFALGMPIREAMKRFTVTYTQDNQIQGKFGDIELTFEVCPSGAIYFIESKQPLGHFIVDKTFLDSVAAKLFAKYGPGHGTPDNLWWGLTEPVRYTTGEQRLFTTNRMSALVTDYYGEPVSLDLKMLDFRICWAEYEKANRKPRDKATEAVKF
jgi:hypothetical protein